MNDNVNHPSHYNEGKIECIEYIKAKFTDEELYGFCIGNAIKYITRAEHKGKKEEDLRKAIWYIDYYLKNETVTVTIPISSNLNEIPCNDNESNLKEYSLAKEHVTAIHCGNSEYD